MVGFDRAAKRLKRAARAHRERSRNARRVDEANRADEVVRDPDDWEPVKNDLAGVDTPSKEERVRSVDHPDYAGDDPGYHHDPSPSEGAAATANRLGTIAPVMGNPSLDPAGGSMVAVSYMAGYGGDADVGHDAMDGVHLLVTGEADANRELEVESATEGGPLDVADDESIYRGEAAKMAMTPDDGYECRDWCSALELHEAEAPEGGWL